MNNNSDEVYGWILKCTICGTTWILEVSFDIRDVKKLYHFCEKCNRNTFHDILGRKEKDKSREIEIN